VGLGRTGNGFMDGWMDGWVDIMAFFGCIGYMYPSVLYELTRMKQGKLELRVREMVR